MASEVSEKQKKHRHMALSLGGLLPPCGHVPIQ